MRVFAKIGAAAALVLATLALGPTASAQPDELKLTLGYDGRLLHIKVLEMTLQEQLGRTEHASSARISSYGVLDAFKHFDIDAQESGRVLHGDPQPGVFHHRNHDGKRNREVEVVWQGDEVATTAIPQMNFLGDPPATREQKLGAVGYLTAALRLTVAADNGPCTGTERIFNGKELSEIGFLDPQPVALGEAQKKLGLVNGVRCRVSFKEIAGYHQKTGKAKNQGLDRPILVDFAQVGAGGPWVTARLQAHTALGAAVIELARLKMEGRLPEGVLQAAR